MIITKLTGGLGNQMFQYAIGRSLSEKNNTQLKLDIAGYQKQFGVTPRQYGLNVFNIKEDFALEKDIKKIKYGSLVRQKLRLTSSGYVKEKYSNIFIKNILDLQKDIYLEGFWQTEKYFLMIADIIRKEFSLRNEFNNLDKGLLEVIDNSLSVSLHIRRGDYVANLKTNQFHGACSLEYYQAGIDYLKNRFGSVVLFIFSDDIEWVKDNLKTDQKIIFVSNGKLKDYEELVLMSKCKHNIIANSSFSWWGAWLNNNPVKIVIAPKNWFNNVKANKNDIVPESWVRL